MRLEKQRRHCLINKISQDLRNYLQLTVLRAGQSAFMTALGRLFALLLWKSLTQKFVVSCRTAGFLSDRDVMTCSDTVLKGT